MTKLLLFLNGLCLAYAVYAISFSWAPILLLPIVLFGGSMILLSIRTSRIRNRILFYTNSVIGGLAAVTMVVALVGGLLTSGPVALTVLVILFPVAVLAGNAVQGRKFVYSTK